MTNTPAQRLVICYTTGDGCSYHEDHVLPILYESPEKFVEDFEATVAAKITSGGSNPFFEIGGVEFCFADFLGNAVASCSATPECLTLDEWFASSAPAFAVMDMETHSAHGDYFVEPQIVVAFTK